MVKVFIAPKSVNPDNVGGISRVVEAQYKWLPTHGIDIVEDPGQADILCVHAASWVKPLPSQKVVTHCHGLYWSDYNWNHKQYDNINQAVLRSLRLADAVTVPSEWVARSIRQGSWQTNIHVVSHGVNLEDWTSTNHGDYVLWDKSRQDAVCDSRVVNMLADMMPDVKFLTSYGEPTRNVEVVGTLPFTEHKAHVEQAMLYLVTAPETFGIGTIEAMACGVPVVGWDYGGQSDIVTENTGRLVPVGDYEALAEAIKYSVQHRDEMSIACRRLVEARYQWKNVIKQYSLLYKSLVNELDPPSTPKVSIIVSLYNLGRYLPQCFQSILSQDFTDYEVIVVDDCSTDDSLKIAHEFCQERDNWHVLRTPVNSNMPVVLNTGIKHSHGKYVLPLDADNMLAPGTLSTLTGVLDSDLELDVAYGKAKFVMDDGVTPDTRVSGDGISGWPPKQFSYEAQMMHRNQIPSTAMYRRKWFDISGGYRRRCSRLGEDPDFWCRITTLGARAARVTDAVTLVYRMRGDSRSNTNNEWPWELWYPRRSVYTGGTIWIQDKPDISVIIPVGPGHGDQGITDALDSLWAQTFHNWEVIVVKDCDEIRWLPSWVRYYSTSAVGSGTSIARNIGLEHTRGKCVLFLDADDYLAPNALEKLYQAWQLNPNNYVCCDWFRDNSVSVQIDNFTAQDMLQHLYHPITALYPRNEIRFDESLRVGEDWDYVLAQLAEGHCASYVNEPLVYYRQSSGSNRQGLKDNINSIRIKLQDKWSEKIMACGCGGRTQGVQQSSSKQLAQQFSSNDLVLIEFVRPMVAPLTYVGKGTGTEYRFGSDESHRLRYVRREDAEQFLNRPEFKLVDSKELSSVAT